MVTSDDGRNIFSDAEGEPTAAFAHFIGGQQAAMADFTALFAPNVNSYQRLCHPYASPNNACWSHDNRAAGLRIPASSPVARRVENRLPGADANPYLAAAAILAGIHKGIREQIDPGKPIVGNGYAQARETLPTDWLTALRNLEQSTWARDALGEDFLKIFLAIKWEEFRQFVSEVGEQDWRWYLSHA
ncbi:Gamma-glutamylputrescine synthetase PuuA [compost metagenome]